MYRLMFDGRGSDPTPMYFDTREGAELHAMNVMLEDARTWYADATPDAWLLALEAEYVERNLAGFVAEHARRSDYFPVIEEVVVSGPPQALPPFDRQYAKARFVYECLGQRMAFEINLSRPATLDEIAYMDRDGTVWEWLGDNLKFRAEPVEETA